MKKERKYAIPSFLEGSEVSQARYDRWLGRKALAHVKRDKIHKNESAVRAAYKEAIHAAVCRSNGLDCYTGEKLSWELISTWSNTDAKLGGREYKAIFALLPSVDHVGRLTDNPPNFEICSWRTNDAKGDLSLEDFIKLCRTVIGNQK